MAAVTFGPKCRPVFPADTLAGEGVAAGNTRHFEATKVARSHFPAATFLQEVSAGIPGRHFWSKVCVGRHSRLQYQVHICPFALTATPSGGPRI